MEIDADVLIKATKVDGVYDSDPMKNPDAVRFDHLTYMETINRRLEVMDSTAISLCMDNNLPILVLNLWNPEDLRRLSASFVPGDEINFRHTLVRRLKFIAIDPFLSLHFRVSYKDIDDLILISRRHRC